MAVPSDGLTVGTYHVGGAEGKLAQPEPLHRKLHHLLLLRARAHLGHARRHLGASLMSGGVVECGGRQEDAGGRNKRGCFVFKEKKKRIHAMHARMQKE